jgi:hypothetical protein
MARESLRTKVFISYSHKDQRWLEDLRPHLGALARDCKVDIWDDTLIKSGHKWRSEIEAAVASAKVAVLLISKNFLNSDFIVRNELPPLIEAAEAEGVVILQVILSPCRVEHHPVLSRFQYVNPPSKTLQHMPVVGREEVFVKLTERIDEIFTEILPPKAKVPVAWSLMQALKMQYEICSASRVPVRAFHKLLLMIRIAPDYLSRCFAALSPSSLERIEAWLRSQVSKQLEVENRELVLPASPDDDQTLISACRIATEEKAIEVNARHYFLALLADDASATIKEIQRAVGPERFAALVQKAQTLNLSANETNSIVSSLILE